METRNGDTPNNGNPATPKDPATPKVPESPVARDTADEDEKKKELEIPIRQVPMDGVCGGY